MTDEEAFRAVGHLVGACPGPWSDDTIDVWHQQFARLSDGAELLRVVELFAATWTSPYRPALGEVIAAYDDATRYRRTVALPSGVVHCDGSGWVPTGAGYRPCRRCNPALAAVWNDERTGRDWLNGVGLQHLGVGVERGKGGALKWLGPHPPACHPAPDGVLTVHAAQGIAIARDAYIAEAQAAGRTPNLRFFEMMIP